MNAHFKHVTLILLFFIFLNANVNAAFLIGDNVCVQCDDGWYHTQITDASEDYIRVHYTGYEQSYDEWVKKSSAIDVYTPQVNDTAWIFWKESQGKAYYFEGEILSKNSTGYYVHYVGDGKDTSWDEWKGLCDVFLMPKTGDYVWVRQYIASDYYSYGQIISHTDTDEWNVHYGGYCTESWCHGDEWHDFNDTFTPPAIIPATLDEQKTIKEAFDDHQPVTPPTGVQIYTFSPVENPDILDFYHVSTPSKIKPIGIGNIVTGGNTMNISFDVPNFTEPMNIYFAVVIQALPNDLFLYGADKSWHHYNTEGLIAAIENKTWSSKVTTLENIDITVLPETTFNLFLVAAKGADLSNAYIWNTSYEVDKTGTVTGNPLQCVNTLESELIPLIDAMEEKGTQEWYDKAKQYVESYRDEDGNSSPGEAYSLLMWAAYLSDNIYPFCWASFNGLLIDPDDPMFLNSTVVGLFELGKIDLAGRFLDCTIKVAPEFPLTWDNVAFYYNSKGDAPNAIKAKEKAVGAVGNDEHPHAAWDGYHYAKSKGLDSAAASFDQNIPSNYGLLKADGSVGAGKPILRVCCSCNGKFFNDVNACVGDCPASLGCFTNICTPNVMCCDLNGVFSVEGGLCYPPGGAQVCIEVDHNGNATLKAGADILFIEAYAGATTNFKNKHSVFIEAKALGQKAKGYVYNSDPHAKMVETTFSPSIDWDSKMVGRKFGVSFGANFDHGKILRSIICAAQN